MLIGLIKLAFCNHALNELDLTKINYLFIFFMLVTS